MTSNGLKQAQELYRNGDLAEAHKAIEGVLRAEPNNVEATLLAAELYRRDNPQLALKAYLHAAKLAPQRPEAPAGMAWLYLEQGDISHCDQCLDRTIDLDPEYLRAHYYADMTAAARAMLRQGESARTKLWDLFDGIAAAYQRAIERYPISPLVSYNLARVLFVLGETEMARQYYKQCLELDPEMTEAYAGMAEASLALEQFEEAVEWCKLVEGRTWPITGDAHDPQWVAASEAAGDLRVSRVFRIQAKAYLWMGQFEQMTQAVRRTAEVEPWNSGEMYVDILDEHVKLGRALLENNQVGDAINVLEVGRDWAERMKYHPLFLWLAKAYLAQALASQAAQERKKAEEWLANAASVVNHPPVPVPKEARAAWAELKAHLTLGDKPSVFGFLRK